MNAITPELLAAIRAHAESAAPNECCGLLVALSDGINYWPCRNRSTLFNQFDLHPEDWADAEDIGEIKAVVHSHVDQSAAPSQIDLVGCEKTGLPWLIISHPAGEICTFAPNGYQLPLLGRQFAWGLCDCFTLVRDYYRDTLNLMIKPPPEGYAPNFWKKGQRFYSRFREWGFVEVPQDQPPQLHDVFLMQIKSDDEPNHAGIYLGDGLMLHHLEERLSERVPYGGFWQKATRYTVRHESL